MFDCTYAATFFHNDPVEGTYLVLDSSLEFIASHIDSSILNVCKMEK